MRLSFAVLLFAAITTAAVGQQRKPIRFWNLTLHTVTHLQLSPAGQEA